LLAGRTFVVFVKKVLIVGCLAINDFDRDKLSVEKRLVVFVDER
jgi:hypothetical protein